MGVGACSVFGENWSLRSEWHLSGIVPDAWDGSGMGKEEKEQLDITQKGVFSELRGWMLVIVSLCSWCSKSDTSWRISLENRVWFVPRNSDADALLIFHFRNAECVHHQCSVTVFCVTRDQRLSYESAVFLLPGLIKKYNCQSMVKCATWRF